MSALYVSNLFDKTGSMKTTQTIRNSLQWIIHIDGVHKKNYVSMVTKFSHWFKYLMLIKLLSTANLHSRWRFVKTWIEQNTYFQLIAKPSSERCSSTVRQLNKNKPNNFEYRTHNSNVQVEIRRHSIVVNTKSKNRLARESNSARMNVSLSYSNHVVFFVLCVKESRDSRIFTCGTVVGTW